jgi:GNAT superfamily N-acetyltransferase
MIPISKDAPEPVVAEAWCKNMLALFRLFGKAPTVEYMETPLFARWHTRLSHPYFEGVQVFQPPPDKAEEFIQEQIAYFQDRGMEFFTWWLHPPLVNADWEVALCGQGFTFDPFGPYLALALDEMPEAVPWPKGLEIRVVEAQADLSLWIETMAYGYEFLPEWKEPFTGIYESLGYNLPLRHYLGFLHGVAVATATLFLAEGVAGIWNISTFKEARGQGIGGAITWQTLLDARKMGYSIAALQASKMGFPVYQRIGFRKIACPGIFMKTL